MSLKAWFACVALAFFGVACGIPTDDEARPIESEEIPLSIVVESTTPLPTDPQTPTAQVDLYFLRGEVLVPAPIELPRPVRLDEVLNALLAGPDSANISDLGSVLTSRDEVASVRARGGVAIVELGDRFVDIPSQTLALAQVVYTVTSRPGVGQVRFVLGGKRIEVPRADGSLTKDPVTRDDYSEFLS